MKLFGSIIFGLYIFYARWLNHKCDFDLKTIQMKPYARSCESEVKKNLTFSAENVARGWKENHCWIRNGKAPQMTLVVVHTMLEAYANYAVN